MRIHDVDTTLESGSNRINDVSAFMIPLRPRFRDELLVREIDDDLVAYDAASDQTYVLNASVKAVVNRCDGRRTLHQIADELADEFPAASGETLTTVASTVHTLTSLGVLARPISRHELVNATGLRLSLQNLAIGSGGAADVFDSSIRVASPSHRHGDRAERSLREFRIGKNRVLLQTNCEGVLQSFFETIPAPKTSNELSPPEVSTEYLEIHQDNGYWNISRNGQIRAQSHDQVEFEQHLRQTLRSVVVDSQRAGALLAARLCSQSPPVLEIEVAFPTHPGTATAELDELLTTDEPPLVLLVDRTKEISRQERCLAAAVGITIIELSKLESIVIILRPSLLEPRDAKIDCVAGTEVFPGILSAVVSLGSERALGLDLVLELMRRSAEIRVEGRKEMFREAFEWFGRTCVQSEGDASRTTAPGTTLRGEFLLGFDFPSLVDGVVLKRVDSYWVALVPDVSVPILLDAQAVVLLQLCDGQTSLSDIVAGATAAFGGREQEIQDTLSSIMWRFRSFGLISNRTPGIERVARKGEAGGNRKQNEEGDKDECR